jgi:hypothetical protein
MATARTTCGRYRVKLKPVHQALLLRIPQPENSKKSLPVDEASPEVTQSKSEIPGTTRSRTFIRKNRIVVQYSNRGDR